MSEGIAKKGDFNPNGFTLLELILVMVIISTVLAMAAPSLRGFFSSRRIHDAAGNILSLMRFARSHAITEGRTYRLNFDPETGVYWLTSNEKGGFSNLNAEFGREFQLPDDTKVEIEKENGKKGDDTYIAFFPQGMVESGTIILTDRSGDEIALLSQSPAEAYRIIETGETGT